MKNFHTVIYLSSFHFQLNGSWIWGCNSGGNLNCSAFITWVALIKASNGELVVGFKFMYFSYFKRYRWILFSFSSFLSWVCLFPGLPRPPPRPLPPLPREAVVGALTRGVGAEMGSSVKGNFFQVKLSAVIWISRQRKICQNQQETISVSESELRQIAI